MLHQDTRVLDLCLQVELMVQVAINLLGLPEIGYNLLVVYGGWLQSPWKKSSDALVRGAEYAGSWDPGSQALFVKRWQVLGKGQK